MHETTIGRDCACMFGDMIFGGESVRELTAGLCNISAPLSVGWDTTNACNLKCLHCLNNCSRYNDDEELTDAEAFKLIDELIEMKVFNVCLCGGEPLLRKNITDIVRRISRAGMVPSMVTNGFLINESVACQLSDAGMSFVQVSLDGVRPETHDLFRGRQGSFERAVAAIRNLTKHSAIHVAAAFCPTKLNIGEFSDYVDFVFSLGCRHIRMMPLLPLGRVMINRRLLVACAHDMVSFVFKIREAKDRFHASGMQIEWGDPLEHIYLFPRNGSKLTVLIIRPNGDLGISPYLPLVFGNIRQHSIREYWKDGLQDAWRLPSVVEWANRIVCIDDFGDQKVLPYSGVTEKIELITGDLA